MKLKATLAVVAYAATVVLANWMTTKFGLVPVGFGLVATAGTYAAGLSFGARDLAQNYAGQRAALFAVLAGAVLSAVVAAPQIAVASGVAFLLSELLDYAIYTPLRRRGATGRAIVVSNTAGTIVDTFVFLGIAGFPITTTVVLGQIVGKAWMTLLAVAVWGGVRAVSRNRK